MISSSPRPEPQLDGFFGGLADILLVTWYKFAMLCWHVDIRLCAASGRGVPTGVDVEVEVEVEVERDVEEEKKQIRRGEDESYRSGCKEHVICRNNPGTSPEQRPHVRDVASLARRIHRLPARQRDLTTTGSTKLVRAWWQKRIAGKHYASSTGPSTPR